MVRDDRPNLNGDPDTLYAGWTLDLAYSGEDPQVVCKGGFASGAQGYPFYLYTITYENIFHWSRSKGLKIIARSHQVPGLGGYRVPTGRAQHSTNGVSFPTLSVGEDGRHIVVAFTAPSQIRTEDGDLISAESSEGFLYYRVWAVGSSDGGATWGTPFIVQDFAGGGGDSASIEFPSACPLGRMVGDNYELRLVYQARRYPGAFLLIQQGQEAGQVQEVYQYFQRFMVTPEMFSNTSSVAGGHHAPAATAISRIHPNPATSGITVEYMLSATEPVEIALVNGLGEEVLQDYGGITQYPGTHARTINVSGLPAGSYRCAIRQNGMVATQMVNIVR